MRKIGEFNEQKSALRFWNYLKAQGIDSSLEEEGEDEPKSSNRGFSERNLRARWQKQDRSPGMFTLSFIITSVAVFLLSGMGGNKQIINNFLISAQPQGLSEILSGQFWRLFTPIFIHYTPIHILFNMYWLHIFGSQIEKLKGSKFFMTFVLALALFSNLAEFLMSGPSFGGMSGVVYGLFGYVFIKCKYDPGDGFHIDSLTAKILFAWFFLCFLGIFGSIANWAHAGGLLVGLAWGYGSALRWNRGER